MKINSNIRGLSGVYQILNIINGKKYIGSSVDLYNRLHSYLSLAKKGKVHNLHLQSSFDKYGIENFSVSIIEKLDTQGLTKDAVKEKLIVLEQKWVNLLSPEYNKRKKVDLNYQISPTLSTREKISNSMKKAIRDGNHKIKRVQKHSVPVSLFDLNGILIQRFDSCGMLAEYIGRKGECLLRHAYEYGTASHKCGNYMIYLTSEENKVEPYSVQKKRRYESRNKRNKTK